MNIETIFANWIAYENISIDNKSIEEFCHKKRIEDPVGRVMTNRGGWQSNDFCGEVDELKELTNTIINRTRNLANKFEYYNYDNLEINNFWININKKSDTNILHIHDGSVISAVYYVKVPEGSGKIIFHNPVENYNRCVSGNMIKKYNAYNSTTYTYFPKIGDLLLFPSWLLHNVSSNQLEGERISIAFNMLFFIENKWMEPKWK